jgi:TRAP-type C4-dicarboxylate transport system permease small subunit
MWFGELKAASVFKLIFLSALTCFFIMALIFGVMAVLGADTVRINGRPVYGAVALPASLMIAAMISLVFSALSTAGFLLLRLAFPRLAISSRDGRHEEAA